MSKYTFVLNKLVRNKILSSMQADDFLLSVKKLSQPEYLVALKEKLVEESSEVLYANSKDELLTELADLLEVFETLLVASGLSYDDIHTVKHNKYIERGGFEQKVKVDSIQLSANKQSHTKWIDYFSKQQEKYPVTIEE